MQNNHPDNFVEYGTSSVLITPPVGISLEGYFTERKSVGIHDDLYAKVLVIKKGTSKVVIIACDLIGVPSRFASPIREAISNQTGIPFCSIMISATHTHTGPVMSGKLIDQSYLDRISQEIVAQTVAVNQNLESGLVEYGTGELRGYAFNRRYFMDDGTVVTNPGIDNPHVVRPAADVDYSVNVIKISDSQSKPKVVVVNCANHCDTVSGNMISADWPGYLRAYVKEHLGKDVTVIVLNGAEGDVNHFDIFGKRVIQDIKEAERIGKGYGEKVVDICKHTEPLKLGNVKGVCKTVKVPVREIKESEIIKAKEILRRYEDKPKVTSNKPLESQDIARGNEEVMAYFARNLLSVAEKYRGSHEDLELQTLRLGELALVGVGGELFTEIGLKIKRNPWFKHTIIVGLANGYSGYLPTKKAFKEGGYEVMPTEENKMGEEVEEIILKTTEELLKELRAN